MRYTEEAHLVFARFGDELTGDKDEKCGGEEQGDDQHTGSDWRLAASDLIVLRQVVYLAEDLRDKGRVSVARRSEGWEASGTNNATGQQCNEEDSGDRRILEDVGCGSTSKRTGHETPKPCSQRRRCRRVLRTNEKETHAARPGSLRISIPRRRRGRRRRYRTVGTPTPDRRPKGTTFLPN